MSLLIQLSGLILFALVAPLCASKGYAQSSVAERHRQIISMAHDIVNHRRDVIRESTKAQFYFCGDGHLHWYRGCLSVDGGAFPMDARLQLEWFWKSLNKFERRFWSSYIKQIDELIVQYMQNAERRALTNEESSGYYAAVDGIYKAGVAQFARNHGATAMDEENPAMCCAAAYAQIVITTKMQGVDSIEWATAGAVWLSLSTTRAEPECQTFVPGSTVSVAPGSLYYYRLILQDGRTSKRILAPPIVESTGQLVLAWR